MVVNASESFHTADITEPKLDASADGKLIQSIDMTEFRSTGQRHNSPSERQPDLAKVLPDLHISDGSDTTSDLETLEKAKTPKPPKQPFGDTRPPRPWVKPPVKPTEEMPGKPVDDTPGKPADEMPDKPVDDTPDKPFEEAPEKPIRIYK